MTPQSERDIQRDIQMSEREYYSITNRQRRLPERINNTRRKLSRLIDESEELGMLEEILGMQFDGDLIAMERARERRFDLAGYSEGLVA